MAALQRRIIELLIEGKGEEARNLIRALSISDLIDLQGAAYFLERMCGEEIDRSRARDRIIFNRK